MGTLKEDLLQALEASDVSGAAELLREQMDEGFDAWEIHLSLFPVVQRVLNPPFINPHLPKMYRIYRELVTYLRKDEIPALVALEVTEYARRSKRAKLPKIDRLNSSVSFGDIESAIREQDWEKTTVLMATFYGQADGEELARRLLLLGSGYLGDSLGHSVSCTAFILLEMVDRVDQDPWPALATLADYFCKGQFHATPPLLKGPAFSSEGDIEHHLLRATSGRGIVNLHHTITLYAMERVRHLFNREEYDHMIGAWIAFMEEKRPERVALDRQGQEPPADYPRFYETYSKLDAHSLLGSVREMIASGEGRRNLGRFLIKGLCDRYQGDYNPHFFTGLGTALWVMDRYWNRAPVVVNALFQYVDFLFSSLKSES
jgi:hypothetical protein